MSCPHCDAGVPHHTNAATSIGGADRHTIWELHAMDTPDDRGGLQACTDPDRAEFPRSILWQTDCPAWHNRAPWRACVDCDARETLQRDAAQDPLTYRLMLRLEGLPSHGFVVRPPVTPC